MTSTKDDHSIEMLRAEIDLLLADREALLRVAGAAAKFVEKMNIAKLPISEIPLAEAISGCVNALPEETLREALLAVSASAGAQG